MGGGDNIRSSLVNLGVNRKGGGVNGFVPFDNFTVMVD